MRARRAAILAGGLSRRMGSPKAAVALNGLPLISYPLAAARAAGLEPVVVAKADSALPPLDCEVLVEDASDPHPLNGIVTALERGPGPQVVLACDVPLVPPALLAELARRDAPLVVPADPRPQPLVARWDPALLDRLRAAITTGEPLVRLVAELGAEAIAGAELRTFGDPAEMFANVNDPAGLEAAERLLGGQSGTSSTRAL
ncbi:MAG: molybdenum cofactor guanylyltransferase [Solirubrobacterales bacterium]